ALVDLRTVGVGGIDEGDAELDSTHQHAPSTRTIKRFTPYTRAAQAHGAEPEAIHGRVATEGEAATRTIRPQPVRILSGHFAFLFKADSAHSGGYLYRGGQGLPPTDGLSKAALAGRFPRRRVAVRGYRLCILHTPAHRPLRLEYFAPQRAVGPDFPEGKIRVSQARVRRLGGSD